MRTRTCPGAGVGVGISTSLRTSGPPNSWTRIAFIFWPPPLEIISFLSPLDRASGFRVQSDCPAKPGAALRAPAKRSLVTLAVAPYRPLLKMFVHGGRGRFPFDQADRLAPGGGLPIVLAFFLGDPRGQRLLQIGGQRVNVRLVHAAQFVEAAVGFLAVAKFQAVLGEDVADVPQSFRREAVVG